MGLQAGSDGTAWRVTCADGTTYDADVVVSSMPLADLVAAMDNVPDDIAQIAAGLPYRDFVTIGVLVSKLKLANTTDVKTLGGIIPDNWIYVQDGGVKLGRIQVFNNWSPYLVADPVHTVWLGLEYFCTEGDAFWSSSDEQLVQTALAELTSMGVIDQDCQALDTHVERVQKAYPAYFGTYNSIEKLRQWLDTHSGLFCVGRNGQHRYNNMDHSMMTAFLAADHILSDDMTTADVWAVNTESDYHEEKD